MEKNFKINLALVFGRLFASRYKYLIIPPHTGINDLVCYMTNISPEDALRYKPSGEWMMHVLQFPIEGLTAENPLWGWFNTLTELFSPLQEHCVYLDIKTLLAKLNKYKVKELESLHLRFTVDPKDIILGDFILEGNDSIVMGEVLSPMVYNSYIDIVSALQMKEEEIKDAYVDDLKQKIKDLRTVLQIYSGGFDSVHDIYFTNAVLGTGRNVVDHLGYEKVIGNDNYDIKLYSYIRNGTIHMCTVFRSPIIHITSHQVEARWFPLAIKEKNHE